MCGYTPKTLGIHYIAFFSFFVISPGELGGLLRGARAHHDDRRTLEVPGCSSALCLRFSCCRGRARPVSSGCCAAGAAVCGLLACCVRLSITPSSRRRRATTTGGRPAAQAEQQQKSRQPRQGSCLAHLPPLWGSTTGLPVARSLRFVAFSAGQKAEAASYKK